MENHADCIQWNPLLYSAACSIVSGPNGRSGDTAARLCAALQVNGSDLSTESGNGQFAIPHDWHQTFTSEIQLRTQI